MKKKSKMKVAAKKEVKKAAPKTTQIDKQFTKSQVAAHVAECAGISKAQATTVLESLKEVIESHLKKRGPGAFTLMGLAKFRVVRKPATKSRQGKNPFTGEPMTFPAKPARNIVKIRALRNLKEIVA